MTAELKGIDLHMHTTLSDGTDSPSELLSKVRDLGLSVFSVTDHDSMASAGIICPLLKEDDPRFITGVEFSTRDEEGKYHILGYGFDPSSSGLAELVNYTHKNRIDKAAARIEALEREFGITFEKADTDAMLALDNPGKPHLAELLVRYGYADDMGQAIRDRIDRLGVRSGMIRPEEAISAILDGGGIPVLAHPFFGSGRERITPQEMEKRVERLAGSGLMGMECFYSGFSPELIEIGLGIAGKHGLMITAGSDYHGKNKDVELGKTGLSCDGAGNFGNELPEGLVRFLGTAAYAGKRDRRER